MRGLLLLNPARDHGHLSGRVRVPFQCFCGSAEIAQTLMDADQGLRIEPQVWTQGSRAPAGGRKRLLGHSAESTLTRPWFSAFREPKLDFSWSTQSLGPHRPGPRYLGHEISCGNTAPDARGGRRSGWAETTESGLGPACCPARPLVAPKALGPLGGEEQRRLLSPAWPLFPTACVPPHPLPICTTQRGCCFSGQIPVRSFCPGEQHITSPLLSHTLVLSS